MKQIRKKRPLNQLSTVFPTCNKHEISTVKLQHQSMHQYTQQASMTLSSTLSVIVGLPTTSSPLPLPFLCTLLPAPHLLDPQIRYMFFYRKYIHVNYSKKIKNCPWQIRNKKAYYILVTIYEPSRIPTMN